MEKLSLIVADLSFSILGVEESGGMTSILRREKKSILTLFELGVGG